MSATIIHNNNCQSISQLFYVAVEEWNKSLQSENLAWKWRIKQQNIFSELLNNREVNHRSIEFVFEAGEYSFAVLYQLRTGEKKEIIILSLDSQLNYDTDQDQDQETLTTDLYQELGISPYSFI